VILPGNIRPPRRSHAAAGAAGSGLRHVAGPGAGGALHADRVHYNFRWIEDYSGGIICDWGTHLFDTAQWANDTERSGPVEIEGPEISGRAGCSTR
jgi:predicted dehydrogenase